MPAHPRDLEDDQRDDEPDDRVGDGYAGRNDRRAGDHADRDEAVDTRVIAVGHESRAIELAPGTQPHLRGYLVSDETDHAGRCQEP